MSERAATTVPSEPTIRLDDDPVDTKTEQTKTDDTRTASTEITVEQVERVEPASAPEVTERAPEPPQADELRLDDPIDSVIGDADPSALDELSDDRSGLGDEFATTGDLEYSGIDEDLELSQSPENQAEELEQFLAEDQGVGGLDGRNDAEAGGLGGDFDSADPVGGLGADLEGSNAELSPAQKVWMFKMNAAAQHASDQGNEEAATLIANHVHDGLTGIEKNGGTEAPEIPEEVEEAIDEVTPTEKGILYDTGLTYEEGEGLTGGTPGGNGQVYPAGSPAQQQLDAALAEQDELTKEPAEQEIDDRVLQVTEGWGDGDDPLDVDDGHTDPTDDISGDAVYDGSPGDVEFYTAEFEEGYLPPADIDEGAIDPDGHLDPYFGEA